MSRPRFFIGFALVILVIAGALSYFADPSPDGLDSVARRGCTPAADGSLAGDCIAQGAEPGEGPLADYAVGGDHRLTGVAGVAGVAVVLVLAGGLFRVLRRRPPVDSP